MDWIFKDRSVSDPDYIFNKRGFDTEAEARTHFEAMKVRAKEMGGAGSLHHGEHTVDRFSIWCPND
jgi:hypothetical protein